LIDFSNYFVIELATWISFTSRKLTKFHAGGLQVTTTGRLYLRDIAINFYASLPRSGNADSSQHYDLKSTTIRFDGYVTPVPGLTCTWEHRPFSGF
jgi:hypothetical protein